MNTKQDTLDLDAIEKTLAALPVGKRGRPSQGLNRIAADALKANERGVPWAAIVAALKVQGVAISVQRLKKLAGGVSKGNATSIDLPAGGVKEQV